MGITSSTWTITHMFISLRSFPIFCLYLLMIAFRGALTRRFKARDLKQFMIVYNVVITLSNLATLLLFIRAYTASTCWSYYQKDTTPEFERAFLAYHLLKWVELLDTIFMIVRHKSRQISFLHVYHHSSMLLLSDLTYSAYPRPSIAFFLTMNSFVHVILYHYYAMSAINPGSPPWWKKQITQAQIWQFFAGLLYCFHGYLFHGFCIYGIFYGVSMTLLFSNFYVRSYRSRAHAVAKSS